VAKGIIAANIPQKVIVRLAGTNEAEGRAMLLAKDYEMLDTMDLVVKKAVEVAA
jgi:succinyl-CoA synthetase beta subunit